jgi:hypothetical protein
MHSQKDLTARLLLGRLRCRDAYMYLTCTCYLFCSAGPNELAISNCLVPAIDCVRISKHGPQWIDSIGRARAHYMIRKSQPRTGHTRNGQTTRKRSPGEKPHTGSGRKPSKGHGRTTDGHRAPGDCRADESSAESQSCHHMYNMHMYMT